MPRPFRVIIAGGCDFDDYVLLKAYADKMLRDKREQGIEIVCGDARDADSLGARYAVERVFDIKHFPAQWDVLGRMAGDERNRQMGNYADTLIAFWDGRSTGTRHMVEHMRSIGKPVRIQHYNTKG